MLEKREPIKYTLEKRNGAQAYLSGGEVQIAPLGQGELVHRRDYARNVPFY